MITPFDIPCITQTIHLLQHYTDGVVGGVPAYFVNSGSALIQAANDEERVVGLRTW